MKSLQKQCFVIMPITTPENYVCEYKNDQKHFEHVLEYLFAPAIKKAGFECVSPVFKGADIIHEQIISNLQRADLVLCDMSCLNPNVFFELGIRTAQNRPVCLVVDYANKDNIPFDTNIINYHKYNYDLAPWIIEEEIEKIKTHIIESYSCSNEANTLWQVYGLETKSRYITENIDKEDKLDVLLFELRSIKKKMGNEENPLGTSTKVFLEKTKEYLDNSPIGSKYLINKILSGEYEVKGDSVVIKTEVGEVKYDKSIMKNFDYVLGGL